MLEWCPKQYSAGDIDGAGLRKLLGASHHDPLTLLVRETIQNSWDAHRDDAGQALFTDRAPQWTFELRQLTDSEASALRATFERSEVPGTKIKAALDEPEVWVIEISDRATTGLGGPIRADLEFPPETPTDFIDLVFNVGAPQDTEGGGGTYGFGKIAAFGVSRCATVLYRSVPLIGSESAPSGTHRLIGSTIGENFSHRGRRYTGRHWWGRRHDSAPEPLVGAEAERVADKLFRHPFAYGDSGTSILIVQPGLREQDAETAIHHVVDAVLWNAWPKLVPHAGQERSPMEISVRLNGREIPVPDPATVRPFAGFVDALRSVRAEHAGRDPAREQRTETCLAVSMHTFRSGSPRQLVGHVAVARSAPDDIPPLTNVSEDHGTAHFRGPSRHIALMREPELIVTYIEGPPSPNSRTEWCGVFKPTRELDRYFAEAEPPSHDDWLVGRVEDRNGRIFVRRAREHGPRELFRELFTPASDVQTDGGTVSLAHVANRLGHLVGLGQGPGRERSDKPPGKSREQTVEILGSTPIQLGDDGPGVVVDFEVLRAGRLTIESGVALAGGGADRGDEVADRIPAFLGITPPDDADSSGELSPIPTRVLPGRYRAWFRNTARVTLAADIRVTVDGG